jgi:hypothetical protein
MNLPKRLQEQYLQRFDELIREGDRVLGSFQKNVEVAWWGATFVSWTCCDTPSLNKWEINILNLVQPFLREGTKLKEQVDLLANLGKGRDEVSTVVNVLKGLREDLERGFLDDLLQRVEAEVAADYMGQAEKLLDEGQPGKHDHVPAAVLTGALLEKALRGA